MPSNGSSDSFSPVRITALLQTNGQGTIRIGWLVTGPAHRAPHSLGLQFRPQADLLAIHARGKNDGSLTDLAGEWLARVQIASHLDASIQVFGIDAQYARHSRHAIVSDAQNEFHGAVAFALPDPGGPNAIA